MFLFWQKKQFRVWAISLLTGVLLASFISPLITRAFVFNQSLSDIAANEDITLYEDTFDEYRQIYTIVNDQTVLLTSGSRNHTQAMSAREYVVWVETVNGAGQIVLYHIPTDTKLYLTETSTNQKPKVTPNGHVVWERWVDDRWQIFYFDGLSVRQVTEGDVSVDPDILGDTVVFTRQNSEGGWSAHEVDLKNKRQQLLLKGVDAKLARWEKGEIVFPIKREREREEAKERRWKEILDAEQKAQEEEKAAIEAELKRRKEAEEYQRKRDGEEIIVEDQAGTTEEEIIEPPTETMDPETTPTTTVGDPQEEQSPTSTQETPESDIEEEEPPVVPETPPVVTQEDIAEELNEEPFVTNEPEIEPTIDVLPEPIPEVIDSPTPQQPETLPSDAQPAEGGQEESSIE